MHPYNKKLKFLRGLSLHLLLVLLLAGCASDRQSDEAQASQSFTIAVIPDTQNYLDYRHQSANGFAVDGSELFIQQMQWIAQHAQGKGGDIAFVASVGDVWQHQSETMDADHQQRGFTSIDNPFFALEIEVTEQALAYEVPLAIEGYRIISDTGLPFGVAPGNHDYDAMWSVAQFPPNVSKSPRERTMTPEDLGMLHIGGLDNFRSAFGDNSDFFKNRDWYVSSFNGGADSAQVFSAGGYRFLHIALEMQPADDVLAWAAGVIDSHSGLPTIITTHDYLATSGERQPNPIVDLERVDPDEHNSAEQLWAKLISQHDQIFLVLCGHQHGQAVRIDSNAQGNKVYQVLADYQDRGQVGLDAGQAPSRYTGKPVGIGDGWFRLMHFDMAGEVPRIEVRTYSSHYQVLSGDLDSYVDWYKGHEQPTMTAAEFLAADEFVLELDDFRQRFGPAQ